ncbi:MAG TPA: hypothetical protein VMW50_08325 [Dehalococcoidia bacterium]|nr:hypothetical protein [Dehalococcoidia bacterium]
MRNRRQNILIEKAKLQKQAKKFAIMAEGGKAYNPESTLAIPNPYRPGTEAYKLWEAGWKMAAQKLNFSPDALALEVTFDPQLDVTPKIPERKPRKPKKDLEATVLKECKAFLKKVGIFAWRNNTGVFQMGSRYIGFGTKGSSDIIGICPDGKFLAIEVKRRVGGKQSPDQEWFQANIEANNGVYLLVHSADELRTKLIELRIIE